MPTTDGPMLTVYALSEEDGNRLAELLDQLASWAEMFSKDTASLLAGNPRDEEYQRKRPDWQASHDKYLALARDARRLRERLGES